MSPHESGAVLAAGAVLWRPSRKHGVRVALVRRPRYDDWSLPKGKSHSGESPAVTALREVVEETGSGAVLGRTLTTVSYVVSGRPKTVQYFAARSTGGDFVPGREVDRLDWLSPAAARSKMTYEFDRAVLDTFQRERADLRTVLLVRHARAGQRESWSGRDETRPLDSKGQKQAAALVPELLPFGPLQVRAAPLVRCTDTVRPLADRLGLDVRPERALSEDAYRDDPAGARHRLLDYAQGLSDDAPGSVVACSQGGVIPGVVKSLAARSGASVPRIGTPKASFWVLSFEDRRLVQADHWAAPQV
ncbi:NUDIX domain-containing protein [Nakamurella sp. YIM 132087]|uniref:NUDIX domain-containing protein n=1 Tax=Nakamurella alba TaxID=2665158 RepID=A0A7K1FGC8_9ACTN|nr:NUDIX hydrolase [Nakamurella alba]MTD13110.1 NUDIX domain-containing protein [Nakamurella alba]